MKYKIPPKTQQKIEHQIRVILHHFSTFWSKLWFKVAAISIVFFAFVSNLTDWFQINDNQEVSQQITDQEEYQNIDAIGTNEDISVFDLTYYLVSQIMSSQDDNRVNNFSNIGLIINPEFVKKHKVDPKIVAEKQKIVDDYIRIYTPVAKSEMEKYGIPTSITIAQGLLESDAGGSRLARNNNNHFGIKCFSKTCKKGHCINYTDDTHKDFFRNYKSAWGSFRGHSVLLQKPRYQSLYKLKKTDYKGWAHGLREAGYATDKRYGDKLIKIIEVLELHKL